jgi:hypothetical protein
MTPLDVISSILFILSIPVDYLCANLSNQFHPRSIPCPMVKAMKVTIGRSRRGLQQV